MTRFVAPTAVSQLGQGPIFIATGPGDNAETLALSPYKAAVANELERLGYTESARAGARQVAEVTVVNYTLDNGVRRSPVSVGVGGSTGSYGSGVGVGVGINLGGGAKRLDGTTLKVTIRDTRNNEALWEGRADFQVSPKSPLARSDANAQTLASALFREFPGNNGETVEVRVSE